MKLHIECICGLHTTILSIDFSYHKLNWFPCSYTLVGTSNLVWRWHIQSGMHTAQTIRSSCKNIIDVTPSYDITQNYTVISARQSGHYKFFSTLYTSYKRWDRVECILQSFSFARSHIYRSTIQSKLLINNSRRESTHNYPMWFWPITGNMTRMKWKTSSCRVPSIPCLV